MQIVRGVSMGGWEAAKAEVARGSMSSRDVKFFSRYCGWAPGQLDQVNRQLRGSALKASQARLAMSGQIRA